MLAPDICELDDLMGPEWCEEDEYKPVREVIAKAVASVKRDKVDNEIILDTAASKSLFKNVELVSDLHDIDPVEIDGVNTEGEALVCTQAGFTKLGYVMYSEKSMGNILSFGDVVDDAHKVEYDANNDIFKVQYKPFGKIHVFARDSQTNLYTHEAGKRGKSIIGVNTVQENMNKYTKREVKQAKLAREYIRRSNFISEGQLIKAINTGKIKNCEISSQDVLRSIDIFGKHEGNLRGKTTARKTKAVSADIPTTSTTERQSLHIDIMYFNDQPYLLGLFEPLELAVAKRLQTKTKFEQWHALQEIIQVVIATGAKVFEIRCDQEKGIDNSYLKSKLVGDTYGGITLDVTGGRSSVNDVERKIKTIKERIRGVLNTIPYKLTVKLEDWLLQSCLYFINRMPTVNALDLRSPVEKLYGVVLDAKTDLKHGFGDYVEVSDEETDNTMKSRTRSAIALMPTGNAQGSWYYYLVTTGKVVRMNKGESLPMPDYLIKHMNSKADEEVKSGKKRDIELRLGTWQTAYVESGEDYSQEEVAVEERLPERVEPIYDEPVDFGAFILENEEDMVVREIPADEIIQENSGVRATVEDIFGPADEDEIMDIVFGRGESPGMAESAFEPPVVEQDVVSTQEQQTQEQPAAEEGSRYNMRARRLPEGTWKGAAVSKVRIFGLNYNIRQGIERTGDDAVKSVAEEVIKLHDRDTFDGIHMSDLTSEQKKGVLPSKTFLKEKFLSSGEYERTRSRLVGGGHRQDKEIYENNHSPTVATQSVFMIAAIAAGEGKAVATVDFPSAFLNCELPDDYPPIYMKLGAFESMVLAKYDPSMAPFLRKDGTMIVRLKRGLYGLIESARLWYDHLSRSLEKLGFTKNSADICVFNRRESDWSLTTIAVHVDDMLITAASEDRIDSLVGELEAIYPGLSVKRGRVFSYVGMTFDFDSIHGKVKITMDGYVEDVLSECDHITGVASTPAGNNLFSIDEKSTLLLTAEKDIFHSMTAKLLYLGKRVRPDLLVAISFLSKRVLEPTQQDKRKLERVIQYLRGTKEMGIILDIGECISILAYIDSSFGVHKDMKSHTGCVIGIGLGPVYAKSSSQKLNTKSSTEAELVGLSDSSNQVIWTRNFLIDQGYHVGPATIYQDNMSTIAMLKNGGSNSARTRHIAIRYFFVSDRVKSGEITIEYMATEEMLADILTKPLQVQLFIKLRDRLLNWYV